MKPPHHRYPEYPAYPIRGGARGPCEAAVPNDNPVVEALTDDLNTPKAISEIYLLVDKLRRRTVSDLALEQDYARLWVGLDLFGLPQLSNYDPNKMFARMYGGGAGIDEVKVKALIDSRNDARKAKNFKEADRIRAELAAMGIVLKDSKDGTTWEIAR